MLGTLVSRCSGSWIQCILQLLVTTPPSSHSKSVGLVQKANLLLCEGGEGLFTHFRLSLFAHNARKGGRQQLCFFTPSASSAGKITIIRGNIHSVHAEAQRSRDDVLQNLVTSCQQNTRKEEFFFSGSLQTMQPLAADRKDGYRCSLSLQRSADGIENRVKNT
jgi:hypothetical protein